MIALSVQFTGDNKHPACLKQRKMWCFLLCDSVLVMCLTENHRWTCARLDCSEADRTTQSIRYDADTDQVSLFRRLEHFLSFQSAGKIPSLLVSLACYDVFVGMIILHFHAALPSVFLTTTLEHRVDYCTNSAWKTLQQDGKWQKRLTLCSEKSPPCGTFTTTSCLLCSERGISD